MRPLQLRPVNSDIGVFGIRRKRLDGMDTEIGLHGVAGAERDRVAMVHIVGAATEQHRSQQDRQAISWKRRHHENPDL